MTGHVFIYGGIGSGPGETSLKSVKAQLDPQAENYIVHLVSPGGEVFEGFGIYNILKNSGKKITTHIEGVCASIATLIAFAGEEIVMNKTSEFMIHNPNISDLKGDASDLRNVANQLDTIKGLLIEVSGARAARNGKAIDAETLMKLYDNETWLTAQQAMEYGFVDRVEDAIKAVAKVDIKHLKMEKNLFQKLAAKFSNALKLANIKNEFTETLSDGRVVIVMSEDGAWEGKQIVYEDGTPLEAGTYTLKTEKVITVGEGSVITTVAEGPAPEDKAKEEEVNNKIKELEAQLAEAKASQATAEASATAAKTEAATAKAETAKIQNRVKTIEQDFLKLKEEAMKTVGDNTPPLRGPVIKNADGDDKASDPMGDAALSYYKNRNII